MTLIPSLSHLSTSTSPAGAPSFDVVRRGYEREQVEARLRELTDQVAEATRARQAAERHARTLDEELRAARARAVPAQAMSQDSFGFRAEKILRMAEHEAADVRARGAKEATALVEQARADAEKHRHEVEQALISRSTELDQEAAKRNVSIQEREQQAQAMLTDARDECARIVEEAQRNADKLLADAEARADQLQKRAEHDSRRSREAAELELRRLDSLHDGVRSDIGRLHGLLGAEIATEQAVPPRTAAAEGTPVVVEPRTESRPTVRTSI